MGEDSAGGGDSAEQFSSLNSSKNVLQRSVVLLS